MAMLTCLTFARRFGAVATLLALLAACATPRIEPWSVSEGLNAPESAYLDRESGLLFVSVAGHLAFAVYFGLFREQPWIGASLALSSALVGLLFLLMRSSSGMIRGTRSSRLASPAARAAR